MFDDISFVISFVECSIEFSEILELSDNSVALTIPINIKMTITNIKHRLIIIFILN